MPWIALTILLKSAAAVLMKQASDASNSGGFERILNPWFIGALAILFFQAIAWIMALRRLPLARAYPFLSLVFGVNLVAAWALFSEAIEAQHMAGVGLIVLGVIVMRPKTAPEPQTPKQSEVAPPPIENPA